MTPALDAVSRGDLAWWHGDRGEAVEAWRLALDQADEAPAGRAAEAMARVRLLQVGGNFAPFVHERPLDRALAACPEREPWCAVARADWELFMPAFTGADPTHVAQILAGSPLTGPAEARRVAAGANPAGLSGELDGMGQGIVDTGRRLPPRPGTWTLGLGVGGAPGAGVGGVVRFVHPDVAWSAHRLDTYAAVDSRGGGLLSGTFTHASRWQVSAFAARSVGEVYLSDGPRTYALGTLRGGVAWVPQWKDLSLSLGGAVRADAMQSWAVVAGPTVRVTIGERTLYTSVAGEAGFGDYSHLGITWDTRAFPKVLGGTLAMRGVAWHVPTDSPFYRLPSAGGADVLRGASAGRWRAATVAAAQIEYRHMVYDPLGVAVFTDTAWVGSTHVTAGFGLRLSLPPEDTNVTRIDIGFGPGTWGVVAAWGEAF